MEHENATTYSLRLRDTELVRFALEDRGIAGTAARILTAHTDRQELFPAGLECTGESLLRWLRRRFIPKGRIFSGRILAALGIPRNDLAALLAESLALSLEDSYWVVPAGFTGTFASHNFFENAFPEALARIALTGEGQPEGPLGPSPELTTDGALPKAWLRGDDGSIRLHKAGTPGAPRPGLEPFGECHAYQVAQRMGLQAVPYDLETREGVMTSACPLFTDIDTSFVPMGRLLRSHSLVACLETCDRLGEAFAEAFRSMLVFDALICNEDRHFGNFGVLRDNRSGRIMAPAPIFDNGRSLFCWASDAQCRDLERWERTCGNPYAIDWDVICAEVMGRRQKEELERLEGFRFARHPRIDLPEARLEALENYLHKRLQHLLAIPARH